MRQSGPYFCSNCGDEHAAGRSCVRCEEPLLDADGHPIASPPDRSYRVPTKNDLYGCLAAALLGLFLWSAMTLSGEVRLDSDKGVALTLTCAAMMLLIPIYYLRFGLQTWLRDRAHSHALRARLGAAGQVVKIAEATSGVVRIRGRIRALEPVRYHGKSAAAALLRVERDIETYMRTQYGRQKHIIRYIQEASNCGRFLVEDETGVALVDDDAFDIWHASGLPWISGAEIALRDGDEVEIAGPVRRAHIEGIGDEQGTGYRAPSENVLVFDGSPDARVTVLALSS